MLKAEIKKVSDEVEKLMAIEKKERDLAVKVKEEKTKNEIKFEELNYTAITDYGWEDQDDKTIKVHILKGLDGIKLHDPRNIQCEFEPNSFDLKIKDFKGKNWRMRIDPL